MPSTFNERIKASQIFAYPSADAADGGQLNTEENMAALSDKFAFKSFVVKRYGEVVPGLELSATGTSLNITQGECFIEGRYIDLNYQAETVSGVYSIDLSTLKDDSNKTIFDYLNTTYYIMLALNIGLDGCMAGDMLYNNVLICNGVRYVITDDENFATSHLLLGTVKATDSSTLQVVNNPYKRCIIDIEQIGSSNGTVQDWILQEVGNALSNLHELTLTYDTTDPSPSNKTPRVVLTHVGSTTAWVSNTNNGVEIYYQDDNLGTSVNLTITPDGLLYNNGNPDDSFDIIDKIKTLMAQSGISVATKNGTTPTSHGTTQNGSSDYLARADHYHEGYIKNTTGTQGSSTAQLINTPLEVSGADSNGYSLKATGAITASRVYNAVWNDYADALLKAEGVETEPGDIIAKDEYSDGYILATSYNAKLVVGVHSDTYGHLLGGKPTEYHKYVPIAVAGNVRVKVVGKIKIGDFIIASFIPGVGVASNGYVPGTIVGKALETKETDDVDRILMQVMLI